MKPYPAICGDAYPTHWSPQLLRRSFSVSSGDFLDADSKSDAGFPVYGGNGFRGYSREANQSGRQLLIGRVGAKCGNTHIVDGDYWVSEHALRVLPRKAMCLDFYKYMLDTVDLNRFAIRTAQPLINSTIVGEQKVVLPPFPEQEAIATFLDRKTAEIDDLIAKKQKQIELLQEYRTALINEAVTKGLDPNVEMKDSGIEWLGEIPKHWEVKKLAYVSRIGNGSTPSRENQAFWENGDYPWLNSSVVNKNPVCEADQFVTPLALSCCHLPIVESRSVLIGITGQGKTRGMSAILEFQATINQHLAFITPDRMQASYRFLQWMLTGAYSELRGISDGAGSTKGALTCEQLKQFRFPCPPLAQQAQIAELLTRIHREINSLADQLQSQIANLKEYRTALISEAVTGKIDVREAV